MPVGNENHAASAAAEEEEHDSGSEDAEEEQEVPLVTRRDVWGYDDDNNLASGADGRRQFGHVTLSSDAAAVAMSPSCCQLAAATLDGHLEIYSYSLPRCAKATSLCRRRASSCRALVYSGDGSALYSGWSDGAVRVHSLETGALKRRLLTGADAEGGPVSALMPYTDSLLAAGHDDGHVTVWDYRCVRCVMREHPCHDSITDLAVDGEQRWLAATADEGTLTSFCLRSRRTHTQCDMYDAPLTSMALIRGGAKVAVGVASDRGSVNIFNWGHFGEHMSVFKDHPSGVTSLAALSDSLLAVGYDDGCIRLCNLLPHKFIGVIGAHSPPLPVETLSLSADGATLVSSAHDRRLLLWNVQYAHADRYAKQFGKWRLPADPHLPQQQQQQQQRRPSRRERRSRGDHQRPLPSARQKTAADFFSDLPKQDQGCFFWS